jgi:spore maturation protein CgeB
MKILVVGPQFPDSFARNIVVTLREMGHEVSNEPGVGATYDEPKFKYTLWTYLPKVFPCLESRIFARVIKRAQKENPDLVLVTFCSMPPEVVQRLKRFSRKVVCWYTDAISNLSRQYLLASPFDAIFVKEPFMARALHDKLGLVAEYLPECCNPRWHRRLPVTSEEGDRYRCDVTALGTLHYYRAKMFEDFVTYDAKIWGDNCPIWLRSPSKALYTNHLVLEEEKAKALAVAKIVVNTININEIEGVNCSLFEIAGCGAFQIAELKDSLPNLFQPETEIVTFRNRRELKEKVDYYLAHPAERQEIADRAYRRAHAEHTYAHRLHYILKRVEALA